MAVTTTPKALMESAYAYSMKNNPGQIATESTELLQLVIRTIRKFYSIAARVNPIYFAESAVVTAPGGVAPWVRPEGAESIFRLETSGGAEIVLVPHFDREAESGLAAVYQMGKSFYEAGNANDPDPTTDSIRFWYSRRPDDPATITSTIDSQWEEAHNALLILEIAAYLALKDKRTEEVQFLAAQRDEALRLFIMYLEHETVGVRNRWGHIRTFNTQSLVPLNDLLIGGTTVKLDRGGN